MKKKKKSVLAAERVQKEFDHFVKEAIENIIYDVLRTYVNRRNRIRTVNIDDFEDLAAPEVAPEFMKIKVDLDKSSMYFEREKLVAGIELLPRKYRQILEYAYNFDLSNNEIGKIMHLDEHTVRNYKSKAYKFLRRYMEEADDE